MLTGRTCADQPRRVLESHVVCRQAFNMEHKGRGGVSSDGDFLCPLFPAFQPLCIYLPFICPSYNRSVRWPGSSPPMELTAVHQTPAEASSHWLLCLLAPSPVISCARGPPHPPTSPPCHSVLANAVPKPSGPGLLVTSDPC